MAQDDFQRSREISRKLMEETMRISEASRRIPYEAITLFLAGGAVALFFLVGVLAVMKAFAH